MCLEIYPGWKGMNMAALVMTVVGLRILVPVPISFIFITFIRVRISVIF